MLDLFAISDDAAAMEPLPASVARLSALATTGAPDVDAIFEVIKYDQALTVALLRTARMITTPFCLYDCDVPADGAVAFVVSTADYAPDAPAPVRIEAIGTALSARTYWDQWLDPTGMPMRDAARHLWTRTSLTPADVDVVEIYDGFSFLAYSWFENLGFAGPGEAPAFFAGGTRGGAWLLTQHR